LLALLSLALLGLTVGRHLIVKGLTVSHLISLTLRTLWHLASEFALVMLTHLAEISAALAVFASELAGFSKLTTALVIND
jgi:hypothetical protein